MGKYLYDLVEGLLVKDKETYTVFGFYDPHPANCIASWLCPGATAAGYPVYTKTRDAERGCKNLAVYWGGCNFTCGFCQDWIHEIMRETGLPRFYKDEILDWVDKDTTCICFCGGTPDIAMKKVVKLAGAFREKYPGRILRICAETNLTASLPDLIDFTGIVKTSGGGLNVGLKAGSDKVHHTLTGHSNKKIWNNFTALYERFGAGEPVPLLRPSLLLVPGYIDRKEIEIVCNRLASIDGNIPLKFISFLPRRHFSHAEATDPRFLAEAIKIAGECGIKTVSPTICEIKKQKRLIR